MGRCYDIIIIGGGVVGSSVARELARYYGNICVIEKEADVCCGNSGRNTGVLHAGFNYITGSLKAIYTVEGNQAFTGIAQELDIPFRRTGKLTIGFTDKQYQWLSLLKKRGEENGVPGLSLIDQDEITSIEPHVFGKFALYSPTSGILCPYLYTIALAENAKINGVDYFFEHEVKTIQRKADGTFAITTSRDSFSSKWIINSAGINAPEIAAMLGSPGYVYEKVKGEYLLLDKRAGEYLSVPVYPAPYDNGVIDIHVTPTIDGNVLVGPTCDRIMDFDDFETTQEGHSSLLHNGMKLFKNLKREWIIRSFAGTFPRFIDSKKGIELDFLIENDTNNTNVINLIGMNSPALTCAYPIAKRVADIVAAKDSLIRNENFDPYRKGITRFSDRDLDTQQRMIKQNPDYGEIICRCEGITKAEILEALHNPLGVLSVNSIKFRTRATMGRCQGGYCGTRITSILQEHLNIDKKDIHLDNDQSFLFTGDVRE